MVIVKQGREFGAPVFRLIEKEEIFERFGLSIKMAFVPFLVLIWSKKVLFKN